MHNLPIAFCPVVGPHTAEAVGSLIADQLGNFDESELGSEWESKRIKYKNKYQIVNRIRQILGGGVRTVRRCDRWW